MVKKLARALIIAAILLAIFLAFIVPSGAVGAGEPLPGNDTEVYEANPPNIKATQVAETITNNITWEAANAQDSLVWVAKAPMPTARRGLGVAAASNSKIYAIGGYVENIGIVATVEEYNPATDTWETKTDMPAKRWDFAAVEAPDRKIYVIGGEYEIAVLISISAKVDEYDPATNTWQSQTAMNVARQSLEAAVSNNRVYAIGGLRSQPPPPHAVSTV